MCSSGQGEHTYKAFEDLCPLSRAVVNVLPALPAASPPGVLRLTWPPDGERLLLCEAHTIRFSLSGEAAVAVEYAGRPAADAVVLPAGEHESPLDFLAPGPALLSVVAWPTAAAAVADDGETRAERAAARVLGVREPPSVSLLKRLTPARP